MTHSEPLREYQLKEKGGKKRRNNRASEIWEVIKKALTFVLSESQKKRKRVGLKNYSKK